MDYVVKEGDTLFLIAQRSGVTLSDLIKANPQLANPDALLPGDIVHIPAAPQTTPEPGIPGQKALRFVSATEDNRPLQGAAAVSTKPKITLTFDKNVVSANVWENNKGSITLITKNNVNVPIKITRISETENFSQRGKIFVEPVNALSMGTSYILKISPKLKSKAGETLGQTTGGQGVTITFSTRTTAEKPQG